MYPRAVTLQLTVVCISFLINFERYAHQKKSPAGPNEQKFWIHTLFIGSHNILFFHCCCAKSQSVIDLHQARNISLSFTYQLKVMTINNKRPSVTTLSKCVQLQMTKIGKQSHMLLFVLFFFFICIYMFCCDALSSMSVRNIAQQQWIQNDCGSKDAVCSFNIYRWKPL